MSNYMKATDTSVPQESGGRSVTGTLIGDKFYIDVLASVVLSAEEDKVETRSMALDKLIEQASPTITYVGEALPGTATGAASWRIKRIVTSDTLTPIRWAGGTGEFDKVWDDRATLFYP